MDTFRNHGPSRARNPRAWCVLFLGLLVVAVRAPASQPEPDVDSWLASHAFVGLEGCLAVPGGARLEAGHRVLIFEAHKPARAGRVGYVVTSDSAKQVFEEGGQSSRRRFDEVYRNRALWNRIGCWWSLRDYDAPFSLAHYEMDDGTPGGGCPLAIHGAPDSALVAGGDGAPLGADELAALRERVMPFAPGGFSRSKLLLAGYRYRSGPRHELTELFLGKPAYNTRGVGAPIDSIEICRVFLDNARVLAVETFSRASGAEEHVDLEPPQLDENNWFLSTEETLGFLSVDDGGTWSRLSIDIGFEGISWRISRLSEGSPQGWGYYLYTAH